MLDLEDIVETGVVTVVLTFGVIASVTVYLTGSLEGVPSIVGRFLAALKLAFVPGLSLAAWPNVVGVLLASVGAIRLDDELGLKVVAFVAAYLFVTVCLHYVVTVA